jgi:uncharacterized protein
MRLRTPVIRLNGAQRARIREASGKDVASLRVEPVESGSGWLFAAGDKKFWLLKHAAPEYSAARGREDPRIDRRYTPFRLRIGESRIHHLGVFAEERIAARRNVIEYVGEHVNPVEAYRRTKGEKTTYLFKLDEFWRLDGSVGGSGAEFINHSCDPNLRWRRYKGRVLCQSVRTIEAGEELTLDYHFSHRAPKAFCRCGSPKCRGTINVALPGKKKSRSADGSVTGKRHRFND